jgi:predicted porin
LDDTGEDEVMKLKARFFIGSALSAFALTAQAQSSVTMYGIIDEGVHYYTGTPIAGGGTGATTAAQQGALNASRFGFRGTEDLGDGRKAFFWLETGFTPGTGTANTSGLMFDRVALVGLSDQTLGAISAGRQYNPAFGTGATYDPLQFSNYLDDCFGLRLTGVRLDNSIAYRKQLYGFTFDALHAFGGVAGNTSAGSANSVALNYAGTAFSAGASWLDAKDSANRVASVIVGGAKYTISSVTLDALYIHSTRDAGFASAASASGGPLSDSSLLSNTNLVANGGTQTAKRTDNMFTVGATFKASPDLFFTAGYNHDNATYSAGGTTGTTRGYYFVADYFLSKRTDIYAMVDRVVLGGSEVTNASNLPLFAKGTTQRNGITVGVQTHF